MGEKMEATKWAAWALAIMLVLTVIGYGLRVVDKRVEREVLVQSHQYKEGMAERAAVLRASLAEIDARLAGGVDEQTRKGLIVQRATINVQLAAARR